MVWWGEILTAVVFFGLLTFATSAAPKGVGDNPTNCVNDAKGMAANVVCDSASNTGELDAGVNTHTMAGGLPTSECLDVNEVVIYVYAYQSVDPPDFGELHETHGDCTPARPTYLHKHYVDRWEDVLVFCFKKNLNRCAILYF